MTFHRRPRPVKIAGITYNNPRGMPEKWVRSYLERDRTLLALDVMRAFDEAWKVRQQLGAEKLKRWLVTSALIVGWELFKTFFLHH